MNKDKLKYICTKISQINNASFAEIFHMYFLENIFSKISKSKYKDSFIFKGGFVLSYKFGIKNWRTKDLNITVKNISLENPKQLKKILLSILNGSDDVTYEISSAKVIRQAEKYHGVRVYLIGRNGKTREPI